LPASTTFGGAPAHRHVPSRQRFTFADRCRLTPIMDSMALVERSVRQHGWHPQPQHGEDLG